MLDFTTLNNYFYGKKHFPLGEHDDLYSAFFRKHQPCVPLINKENSHGGVHLLEHATFNTASLLSILYARNTFKSGSSIPNGFKLCLKFIFGNMNNGTYASLRPGQNSHSRAAIELDFKLASQLYCHFTESNILDIERTIPSSGKTITLNRTNLKNDFIYTMKYSSEDVSFSVGIDAESLFQIKHIILSLYKIKYVHLSFSDIHLMLSPRQLDINNTFDNGRPDKIENEIICDANISDPLGEEDTIKASDEQRKAIYAIGVNKWPRKDQQTIQYIQQRISLCMADKMIKKANNMGMFDLFEYVYFMLHGKERI